MRKLDIPEKDFYAYALYLRSVRRYKSAWEYMIYKANYGVTPDKTIKYDDDGFPVMPKKPTEEFIVWVDEHIEEYHDREFKKFIDEKGRDWEERRKAVLAKLAEIKRKTP